MNENNLNLIVWCKFDGLIKIYCIRQKVRGVRGRKEESVGYTGRNESYTSGEGGGGRSRGRSRDRSRGRSTGRCRGRCRGRSRGRSTNRFGTVAANDAVDAADATNRCQRYVVGFNLLTFSTALLQCHRNNQQT